MFHHAMRAGYLKPTPLKPYMTYDVRRCGPLITPHLLYDYEGMQGQGPHFPPTRQATIHIHRVEGGKGVKMDTLHWGGQAWIIHAFDY